MVLTMSHVLLVKKNHGPTTQPKQRTRVRPRAITQAIAEGGLAAPTPRKPVYLVSVFSIEDGFLHESVFAVTSVAPPTLESVGFGRDSDSAMCWSVLKEQEKGIFGLDPEKVFGGFSPLLTRT